MQALRLIIDFIFGFGLFINAMLFIPQAIKLYKSKDSKELSKITFAGFCLIQIAAILYGAIHHDKLLLFGYALSLITCGTVTILSFKYSR